jgi:hypothetical protein
MNDYMKGDGAMQSLGRTGQVLLTAGQVPAGSLTMAADVEKESPVMKGEQSETISIGGTPENLQLIPGQPKAFATEKPIATEGPGNLANQGTAPAFAFAGATVGGPAGQAVAQGAPGISARDDDKARKDLVDLLGSKEWQTQLAGSPLKSLESQLSQPGAPVREILTAALDQVEGGYVRAHQSRTRDLALKIAGEMKADSSTLQVINEVGGLFQIGKLGISSEILDFEGKWTPEKAKEWGPRIGKMADSGLSGPLLRAFGVSGAGQDAVFNHKQDPLVWNQQTKAKDRVNPNWDNVSLASRILRVADSVDSMMNNKNGNSKDGNRAGTLEPRVLAGKLQGQVDPEVMAAYLRVAAAGEPQP